jgi:hypothetical protein
MDSDKEVIPMEKERCLMSKGSFVHKPSVQELLDTVDKHIALDGLGQVIGGPCGESPGFVVGAAPRRKHQNGQIGKGAQGIILPACANHLA